MIRYSQPVSKTSKAVVDSNVEEEKENDLEKREEPTK